MPTSKQVVILGINGHVGHPIATAFLAAGWDVVGFGRSFKHPIPGVRFIKGDADSVAEMRAAIGDAEVVVNALNLRYDQWDRGRLEAQTERVVAALGTSGKTLLYPGNVYNYAATDRSITPDTAQRPETPRGAIRVRCEALFEAAAKRGDIQYIVLRAGDFFGPDTIGDWFDLAMLRDAGKGRFAGPGPLGVKHSWAYLPDLARAFEKLAFHRSELGAVERFHFGGHFETPEALAAAIVKGSPIPLKQTGFPWTVLRLIGLVDGVMREVVKMRYLWANPMQLVDPRLDAILGEGFATPFETAVAARVQHLMAPLALRNAA